jgi:protein-S-isoprenylcysteine O-methyltransferase Ste14
MNTRPSVEESQALANTSGGIVKRLIQVIISTLIQALVLFLSAGRLDWMEAWVYLGVYVGFIVVNTIVLLRVSPELIAERARIKEGAKDWDRPLAAIVSLFGPLVTFVIAGLDVRFGWSPPLARELWLAALVFMGLGYGLSGWAMASNRFFSGLVRIQKERGHTVASGGPYRYVRHPGYSGWLMAYVATPFVLGSLWALVPAVLTVAVMIFRTRLEDRTLWAELDGYQAYARRVRYRLLPGVW